MEFSIVKAQAEAVGVLFANVWSNLKAAVSVYGFKGIMYCADFAVVKQLLKAVMTLFPWIGGFFILAGGFKLLMAYRNGQPEAQADAAKDIVIGAAFVAFELIFGDIILGAMK